MSKTTDATTEVVGLLMDKLMEDEMILATVIALLIEHCVLSKQVKLPDEARRELQLTLVRWAAANTTDLDAAMVVKNMAQPPSEN